MIMMKLETGKVYCVITWAKNVFLFKKADGDYITTCSMWIDWLRGDKYRVGYGTFVLTHDERIVDLRIANVNELAFWNKTFNENIGME